MFTPILYIDDNKTYHSYVEGLNDESFSVEERRFSFYKKNLNNKQSSYIMSISQVHHENPEFYMNSSIIQPKTEQIQGISVENNKNYLNNNQFQVNSMIRCDYKDYNYYKTMNETQKIEGIDYNYIGLYPYNEELSKYELYTKINQLEEMRDKREIHQISNEKEYLKSSFYYKNKEDYEKSLFFNRISEKTIKKKSVFQKENKKIPEFSVLSKGNVLNNKKFSFYNSLYKNYLEENENFLIKEEETEGRVNELYQSYKNNKKTKENIDNHYEDNKKKSMTQKEMIDYILNEEKEGYTNKVYIFEKEENEEKEKSKIKANVLYKLNIKEYLIKNKIENKVFLNKTQQDMLLLLVNYFYNKNKKEFICFSSLKSEKTTIFFEFSLKNKTFYYGITLNRNSKLKILLETLLSVLYYFSNRNFLKDDFFLVSQFGFFSFSDYNTDDLCCLSVESIFLNDFFVFYKLFLCKEIDFYKENLNEKTIFEFFHEENNHFSHFNNNDNNDDNNSQKNSKKPTKKSAFSFIKPTENDSNSSEFNSINDLIQSISSTEIQDKIPYLPFLIYNDTILMKIYKENYDFSYLIEKHKIKTGFISNKLFSVSNFFGKIVLCSPFDVNLLGSNQFSQEFFIKYMFNITFFKYSLMTYNDLHCISNKTHQYTHMFNKHFNQQSFISFSDYNNYTSIHNTDTTTTPINKLKNQPNPKFVCEYLKDKSAYILINTSILRQIFGITTEFIYNLIEEEKNKDKSQGIDKFNIKYVSKEEYLRFVYEMKYDENENDDYLENDQEIIILRVDELGRL